MSIDAAHRMACLARAQGLARAQQRPVLLRLHGFLADPPSGAAWEPWRQSPLHRAAVLWHHGRAQTTLAAWRPLRRWALAAAEPAAEAKTIVAGLMGQMVEVAWSDAEAPGSAADMPLCHIALAFDGAHRSGSAAAPLSPGVAGDPGSQRRTAGGSAGELLLAACQVMRQPGATGVSFSHAVWVGPDDALQSRLDEMETQQARLQVMAAAETGEMPPSGMAVQLEESAEAWGRRVEQAATAVAGKVLDKVVLARCASWAAPPGRRFSPTATAWALRRRQATSITYMWARGDDEVFVGASPEVLASVAGAQVTTHALAGTAARSLDPAEDEALAAALLASPKDRREHQVVVDMLQATLASHCEEVEVAASPDVLALAGLQHLQTPLRGRLRRAGGILDLVAALHPTPAVCGWPCAAAYAYLRTHEALDRGWYAGPIGWVTAAGDGLFAVALRSAWLRGDRAQAFAGAGVVAASDPAVEWRETELKLATLVQGLRLAA